MSFLRQFVPLWLETSVEQITTHWTQRMENRRMSTVSRSRSFSLSPLCLNIQLFLTQIDCAVTYHLILFARHKLNCLVLHVVHVDKFRTNQVKDISRWIYITGKKIGKKKQTKTKQNKKQKNRQILENHIGLYVYIPAHFICLIIGHEITNRYSHSSRRYSCLHRFQRTKCKAESKRYHTTLIL